MNIGFIGLGKLGLPCALAAEDAGHTIFGYDINPNVEEILKTKVLPYREEGAQELLEKNKINWSSIAEVVSNSDIIFVPIQTPHDEKYEGVTRLPEERIDFDYTYLKSGMKSLSDEILKQGQDKIVVIISTVLPGTVRREIKPLLNDHVKLCYNPFFIAMGTTIKDFTNPEFILFGVDDEKAYLVAKEFYSTLHDKPVYKCSIEEAEMIKVTYNTYITMKICLANTVMELSHKMENINCDNVMKGLFMANERLISPKYLIGGMGDGGGCHPRDNIALSWLAKKVDLSYDWYENLMYCRENQTEWLGDLIIEEYRKNNLPIVVLGKTFKKETNLVVGSPSILLKNLLDEKDVEVTMFDPWVDNGEAPIKNKSIFFIGTNHDLFLEYNFPEGSIVIDPWRFIKKQEGIKLISVGDSRYEK
jgi:UDPglucose 6-dehydrogenase